MRESTAGRAFVADLKIDVFGSVRFGGSSSRLRPRDTVRISSESAVSDRRGIRIFISLRFFETIAPNIFPSSSFSCCYYYFSCFFIILIFFLIFFKRSFLPHWSLSVGPSSSDSVYNGSNCGTGLGSRSASAGPRPGMPHDRPGEPLPGCASAQRTDREKRCKKIPGKSIGEDTRRGEPEFSND